MSIHLLIESLLIDCDGQCVVLCEQRAAGVSQSFN